MGRIDYFQLLELPRQAWLPSDDVRKKFQQLAAAVHPDKERDPLKRDSLQTLFTGLNDACACLSSTPRRLRHLLELEYPALAAQRSGAAMDDAMMDLFSTTAAAIQQAASVLARKQKAATALTKAMLAGEVMQAQEALESAAAKVEAAIAAQDGELRNLDAARKAGVSDTGLKLASGTARAAFLEKWQAQIRAAFAGFFGD